jgi:dsDNA-specific endonuclease/ATPase MutS2
MSREEPFDSKEKEEIYQHSRAPVKKLEEDYRSLKEELDSVWDLKIRYSKEYQLKVEHLNEIWLKASQSSK